MTIIIVVLSVTILVEFVYLQSQIDTLKNQNQTELNPFIATGLQQTTKSINNQYDVTSWNFTFQYTGKKTIQNVNFFLDNQDTPFKSVPEVAPDWMYTYIWTPEDLTATRTVTVSWQGGVQTFNFEP
ncbi:hypothetical protein GX563_06380 [Candidatus Bathyarchaeota archaeon]|nr:hypothetical protein [Candidatus Bathyarchaeota archaeon]